MGITKNLLEIRLNCRPTELGSAFHEDPQEVVCTLKGAKHFSRTLPATLACGIQSHSILSAGRTT